MSTMYVKIYSILYEIEELINGFCLFIYLIIIYYISFYCDY